MSIGPVLAFASFVLWLHAFPMGGFLAAGSTTPGTFSSFLAPFVLFSLSLPRLARIKHFHQVTQAAIVLLMACTILAPWLQGSRWGVLFLLGCCAPLVLLRCVGLLRRSGSPVLCLALAIAAGNLLLGLLQHAPGSLPVKALLVGLLPGVCLPSAPITWACGSMRGFAPYLPFVFGYFFVSGLMYGDFLPVYLAVSPYSGAELAVYILAVLAAPRIMDWGRDLPLVMGVVLSMFALSLFQMPGPVPVTAGMFLMQGSGGIIDLFAFALILSQKDTPRALGLGAGLMCLGILAGVLVSAHLSHLVGAVTVIGNAALALSVLAFYLYRRGREPALPGEGELAAVAVAGDVPAAGGFPGGGAAGETGLPPGLAARLSPREKRVLEQVLRNMAYTDVARSLDISPSSVKTYMKRIFRKAGVSGKAELLERLGGNQSTNQPIN